MSTDEGTRRYDEDEVRRIFAEASRAPRGSLPARSADQGGLTLSELQEIGSEVGLDRDAVARAAHSLDVDVADRTMLGVPIGVSHARPLPRNPTATEWEHLVADLRRTFQAPGKVEVVGNLRRWSNGNLNVFVEPGPDGPRLRMETYKESAAQLGRAGGAVLAMSLLLAFIMGLGGDFATDFMGPLMLFLLGGGVVGTAMAQLPSWARARREQMEAIGERTAAALAATDPEGLPPAPDDEPGGGTSGR